MADVVLARLTSAHAPAMLRWLQDPEVRKNLGLRNGPNLEKTNAFVASAATDDDVVARAIVEDGAHVGTVVLDHIDRTIKKARLHIYLGEAGARGRGTGKKAVRLVLDLAFGSVGLEKVWLTVHAGNARARAAYLAVGFVEEGVHRREFLLDGELVDEIYMGILKAEHVS